ncbi:hypothetical protein SAMN05444161_4541 [Rhizobiales bacterium GAS191]|nr:hypothetical protein SAMN05519103_03835 [Rhizobiales bacterium GAS113]SED97997.1 hypothetical protein SAMN05444161_4541 [Rhizobiales bacterium GAS191]
MRPTTILAIAVILATSPALAMDKAEQAAEDALHQHDAWVLCMAKVALSLSKTPASHGAVAAMAVQSCQVDEAAFVNALAMGIGRIDALAVAKLERKRYQEGFTEEVAKVRIERQRKGS